MSDKPIFDPEKIKMIDHKLLSGQIETPEEFMIENVIDFDVENTLQMSFNLDKNLVKVDFSVIVKTKSERANDHEAQGSYHFIYIYRIENIEALTKKSDTNLTEVDARLATALSSISYSTSRGILLTRMQGTAFQHFILPIIDPGRLLKI